MDAVITTPSRRLYWSALRLIKLTLISMVNNDEAAAPLICNVKVSFDSLAACNNIELSNRAVFRGVH